MHISLVVNTLNEEANIADCIASVSGFADEVIVVDMESSDRTASIASSFGAVVHTIPREKFVDPARNKALSFASGDWILVLDADERLTPAVAAELKKTADGDMAEVVNVPFEVHMFGRIVRYSGWQDTRKKVFFKNGFLKYTATEVHGQPECKGRLAELDKNKGQIVHLNYRDIGHFFKKLNDYTDGEALKLVRTGGRNTPLKGIYWGLRHFFRRYLLQSGYRDGYTGLMLCAFMGFYWFLAFCKAWELENRKA